MDFLPTPPTLTLPQVIVKREDKDTKLVVRGSFGNTQEGGTGEWEGSEGLWGEETTALFKLHTPHQGAGAAGGWWRGVWACVCFYPLLSCLRTRLSLTCGMRDTHLPHKVQMQGREEARRHAPSRSLISAWARAQQMHSVSWWMGLFSRIEKTVEKAGSWDQTDLA